jgi:hypothetical protein
MWDYVASMSAALPPAAPGGASTWSDSLPALMLSVILAVIGLFAYLHGFHKTKLRGRRRWAWFWPPDLTRVAHEWTVLVSAAIVLTVLALGVSFGFYSFTPKMRVHSTPGILFIIVGLMATLAGLLNTIALLNLRLGHITSFESLFYRLAELEAGVQERHPPALGPAGDPEPIYLLDYTPRIGEISEPDVAEHTQRLLFGLKAIPRCECHFVFLASSNYLRDDDPMEPKLERFYRRTVGRTLTSNEQQDFHAEVKRKVDDANRAIDSLEGGTVAVWRSRRIHSEHYFVTRESALVYYVTPQVNGNKNELKGEKTDDLAQVDFTREVVIDYIRDAITPHLECCKCGLVVSFAVGQSGIKEIELLFGATPRDLDAKALEDFPEERRKTIAVNGMLQPGKPGDPCLYACKELEDMTKNGMAFIKVRLRKEAVRSPDSYIFSIKLIPNRTTHVATNGN